MQAPLCLASAGQELAIGESSASATGFNLTNHGSPVPFSSLALAAATLSVKVRAELNVGVKDNVVTKLGILENLKQVKFT